MEKLRIGITSGDTNGIGNELILKAFEDIVLHEICTPVVYSRGTHLEDMRKTLDIGTQFSVLKSINDVKDGRLNVIDTFQEECPLSPGEKTEDSQKSAKDSMDNAFNDWENNQTDAIVAMPTEEKPRLNPADLRGLDMLLCKNLRMAFVTTGLKKSELSSELTGAELAEKMEILNDCLRRDFGIGQPRIAILSLNHKDEEGRFGVEERDIIIPTMEEEEKVRGIHSFGPYEADPFFADGMYRHYDAVMALYKEQGVNAFDNIVEDEGVIFTAGRELICTSPYMGTLYNNVGKNDVSTLGFLNSIYLATDIFNNRLFYDESNANPLPKLFHDRREDDRRRPREDKFKLPNDTDREN